MPARDSRGRARRETGQAAAIENRPGSTDPALPATNEWDLGHYGTDAPKLAGRFRVGYGMWGLGGWSDPTMRDAAALNKRSRTAAFFDTAWAYGAGHSEQLPPALRSIEARASTSPRRSRQSLRWIQLMAAASTGVPGDHIQYTEKSLENLGVWTPSTSSSSRVGAAGAPASAGSAVDDLKRRIVRAGSA